MPTDSSADDSPLFCDRCLTELRPGDGNFYVVRIDAVADPSPPTLDGQHQPVEYRREIERLLLEMRDMSEQELLDQVRRRVILHLCVGCYVKWIENPAG